MVALCPGGGFIDGTIWTETERQERDAASGAIERKIKPEIRRDGGFIHHRCALNTEPRIALLKTFAMLVGWPLKKNPTLNERTGRINVYKSQ